ncbi:hypothetical protein AB4Y85_03905 [Microvirga sp. 2YAF29]|uniref:hypothetical protein n=1 Tax=Microvirga sp. 2YAF29 TaxID=3233031 RepID=UPI003F956D51
MFSRDEAIALSIACVIAFLVVAFAVFAGVTTPASERVAPACSEWTDGCVVCARRPEGLACSTPGIACVRQAPKCLKP